MLVKCGLLLSLCVCSYALQFYKPTIKTSGYHKRLPGEALLAKAIPVTDDNWYFTEHNWVFDPNGQWAQTVNPGAYFKLAITGTTSLTLQLMFDDVPQSNYMTVRYSLDDAPYVDIVLSGNSNTSLTLGTNLNSTLIHTVQLWLKNSVQEDDRWVVPLNKLCITGVSVDPGAQTVPPALRSKRLMFFWDSIGEGVRTLGVSSGGDLTDNDCTVTWANSLAAALDAELNAVAFGGQGYLSWGTAVPLITPGNASLTAWNQFYSDHSRLDSNGQLTPNPDYVLCGHGTNDGWGLPQQITALAFQWMVDFRAASPNTVIFLTVPFGGFFRDAITLAFKQYTTTGDRLACLLDLGDAGAEGVSQFGSPNAQSGDGLHPLAIRSEQLGAMLTMEITACLYKLGL